MEVFRRLIVEEEGQGFVEYALMVGLVALGIWVAVSATGLGDAITGIFNRVSTELNGCVANSCP